MPAKIIKVAAALVFCLLTSCNYGAEETGSLTESSEMNIARETVKIDLEKSELLTDSKREVFITVNDKVFTMITEENKTGTEFYDRLPLELEMTELNGNEKYYYLDTSITASPERVGHINEGDVMLYGDSCIVIFYKSFDTSYSYTKIGHITDCTGLAAALGSGSVDVSFEKGVKTAEYTADDVRALSDFIIKAPDRKKVTDFDYDLDKNGKWNVSDLSLMKNRVGEN